MPNTEHNHFNTSTLPKSFSHTPKINIHSKGPPHSPPFSHHGQPNLHVSQARKTLNINGKDMV